MGKYSEVSIACDVVKKKARRCKSARRSPRSHSLPTRLRMFTTLPTGSCARHMRLCQKTSQVRSEDFQQAWTGDIATKANLADALALALTKAGLKVVPA